MVKMLLLLFKNTYCTCILLNIYNFSRIFFNVFKILTMAHTTWSINLIQTYII